jgi:hypothetical protein
MSKAGKLHSRAFYDPALKTLMKGTGDVSNLIGGGAQNLQGAGSDDGWRRRNRRRQTRTARLCALEGR